MGAIEEPVTVSMVTRLSRTKRAAQREKKAMLRVEVTARGSRGGGGGRECEV